MSIEPSGTAPESKGTLRVLQLYPRDMNIYGDWGNALVLKQRISWHGYTPELLEYNVGDDFPADVDLIVARYDSMWKMYAGITESTVAPKTWR